MTVIATSCIVHDREELSSSRPTPYTLPTPYALHPTPCTLPTPSTLRTPYTLWEEEDRDDGERHVVDRARPRGVVRLSRD